MAVGHIDQIHNLSRPFSNFSFLSTHEFFKYIHYSLPRIFCESRRAKSSTLVVEDLDESEETFDETLALKKFGLIESKLWRLTFWIYSCNDSSCIFSPPDDSLVGYAIIRADTLSNCKAPIVHVFESVFRKYEHFHNFVPHFQNFEINFESKKYSLPGIMYCQQNGMTKACAQVALRSLLTTRYPKCAIKYSEINRAAKVWKNPENENGLNTMQIRSVLKHFKINYRDIDYFNNSSASETIPYRKLLYAGIENGGGGLLGFELSGLREDSGEDYGRHIIPFFGHTFNQDTWAPRSQNSYFHINEETRYIPSDEWLSSFIGHDDNFGSNYCIPKDFLKNNQVTYAVALLPNGYKSDPFQIEAIAADQLHSLIKTVPKQYHDSFWLKKLNRYIEDQDVVFRTKAISGKEYIKHLKDMHDWENRRITDETLLSFLTEFVPECLWMVELSVPEIFSTNYGKLGEIIFFGDQDLSTGADYEEDQLQQLQVDNIISVRFPGVMLIRIKIDNKGEFIQTQCDIKSHVPLFACPAY